MTALVLVHPDDMNLADAKALAAEHNATVVGCAWIPRGQVVLTEDEIVRLRP